MDKEIFKKIECRIYRYYDSIKKIDKLEYRCMVLENTKEQLRQDIINTNVKVSVCTNMGIGYEERVQTSPMGTSYVEGEIVRQVEKLELEWKSARKEILRIHAKIREISKQDSDMKYAIELLDTQHRLIAEMKYKDKLSLEKIGFKLNMDKSTVSRSRERIVKYINKIVTL
ncbi:hypothetical protein [Clostridium botulinum]|uniref:hypothetical protein n=1 Tax=Clostridium botulinum TaxID=1491 RepID=UPI000ACA1F1E|nr:hypothetical protein [Clostridium botulinum]